MRSSSRSSSSRDDGVAALKAELETLKAKIASGVIAAQRPALDGVKSAEAAASSTSICGAGSRAGWRPRRSAARRTRSAAMRCREEIDRVIDETLTAISPIRAIANVVKVGSAGYRKLIASGGTPSGWVGFEAARPETGDADVQRDRAGVGRALRQSGGVAADARRCDVRRREMARARDRDRVRPGRGRGVRRGHRREPAARVPELAQCGDARRCPADGHAAVRRDGQCRRVPGEQSGGQADRPRPGAALALPAGRGVRDELGDGGGGAQVQDRGRRVHVPAEPGGGAAGEPARLSADRGRGHARHRRGHRCRSRSATSRRAM